LLLCGIAGNGLFAQTWQTLSNVPILTRYNDVYFVTAQLGWIVNGSGQIYRTADGGASWQKQFDKSAAHFRSIGFFDAQHGWAGNVGPGEFGATDTTTLYQTNDGGQTWLPMNSFIGPKPRGLCGMHVVNDSVICAVGRVRGPAFFARTIDRGQTWRSQDMSAFAAGLIDVYFFHPDTGMAVGLTNVTHNNSSGVILYTSDGGATWAKRFLTARSGEWCWKISFPSRSVGYVSLQRNSATPIYFLKTADGGDTWQEKLFSNSYYFVQGLGFVDEQNGWIGGNSSFPSYQTKDGGETWQSAGFGASMNRVRFLGDTLGYAVGRVVYKYTKTATHVAARAHETPNAFALAQNYPNPFSGRSLANASTTIRFHLPKRSNVRIKVFDVMGREITQLVHETREAGEHVVRWDAADREGNAVRPGIYFYSVAANDFSATRKMVVME
jgi:photosystem II stability/assembly factor-like uncharacterized protein